MSCTEFLRPSQLNVCKVNFHTWAEYFKFLQPFYIDFTRPLWFYQAIMDFNTPKWVGHYALCFLFNTAQACLGNEGNMYM